MKLTFKDILFWYKIYEKQMAEESVIKEYANKNKPIPEGATLQRLIKAKIKKWNTPEVDE